jgi:hypothetical protein
MIQFLKRLFCRHRQTELVRYDYQERYEETVCTKCGKHLFQDI